jgi:hypothetical protein
MGREKKEREGEVHGAGGGNGASCVNGDVVMEDQYGTEGARD